MRRLLASDLLPQRAGQPVKALVPIGFAELLETDANSVVQDKWIGEYRPGGPPSEVPGREDHPQPQPATPPR